MGERRRVDAQPAPRLNAIRNLRHSVIRGGIRVSHSTKNYLDFFFLRPCSFSYRRLYYAGAAALDSHLGRFPLEMTFHFIDMHDVSILVMQVKQVDLVR
jgi:hypothetical protein